MAAGEEKGSFRKDWDCNPGQTAASTQRREGLKATFRFGGTLGVETERTIEVAQDGLRVYSLGRDSAPSKLFPAPPSGLSP